MSDDLDRLDKLAEAATPGPWAWHSRQTVDGDSWAVFDCTDHALAVNRDGWVPDAEFIAAANPTVVRELIKRVRKAARAHRLVAKLYGKATAERDAALAREAKVRELHMEEVIAVHESYGPERWCPRCQEHYPCPTIRALDADGKETNE